MRLVEPGQPLQLRNVRIPQTTGRSVLVKVDVTGVCHTDIHLVAGGYDLGEGRTLSMRDRGIRLPITPGHEVAGRVDRLGPRQSSSVIKEGDSVVVYPWIGCGSCRKCRAGRENLCETRPNTVGIFHDGGYAEYVLVPDERYLVKIDKLDPIKAAPLPCSGLTAYSALKKCELMSDDFLVIIGAGGLGSMAIQLAKKLSTARVAVFDVGSSKLDLASELGADYTFNIAEINKNQVTSEVKQANMGRGPDAVIDFVGNQTTSSLGFELLGREGRLVLVGLFGGVAQFPLPFFPLRGTKVIGNYTGTLRDLTELVQLTSRGLIRPIVSSVYKLEEANSVLEKLKNREITGRALLNPSQTEPRSA